jgi:hypothetical protein
MYWVWLGKPEFLKRAVTMNPYHANFFAWVDIGYFRDQQQPWAGYKMLQYIPTNLAADQVVMLDVNFNSDKTPNPKPISKSFTVGAGFIG